MRDQLRKFGKELIPLSVRRQIIHLIQWPPVGKVRWGSLRRVTPFNRDWGSIRGLPVDRYYIEEFLAKNSVDIQGRVLEVKDNTYTRKYGGDRVTKSDVLHKDDGYPYATIVADITTAEHIPDDSFDCIIFTQTLQFIFDVKAAISTLYRILKPGGVLLVTLPGITQISRYDLEHWGDYWRFTSLTAQLLFQEVFPKDNVKVQAHGNVLGATALLYGVASGELLPDELDTDDPDYEVLITIRAVKPGGDK